MVYSWCVGSVWLVQGVLIDQGLGAGGMAGALTAGTVGAAGTAGVDGRMKAKPIRPSVMRTTTLMTMISPMGRDFFFATADAGADGTTGAGAGGATTGAGALLIMRVKSLGPDEDAARG